MTASPHRAESLPTIVEIKSSTVFLSREDAWSPYRVVRVRDHIAVKFGAVQELLVEAETMQFLHAHIGASVPRVYGTLIEDCPREDDPAAKCYYLLMEYIAGKSYLDELPSLAPAEKKDIQRQFRSIMDEDLFFAHPESEGQLLRGPFTTEEDLNNGVALLMDRLVHGSYSQLLRECITDAFRGHRPVLTHGDLQDRNLVISQVGEREHGHWLFKLTLIDWQYAGWFPDYWDFCVQACNNGGGQDWKEFLQAGLDPYPKEFPLMYLLRQTIHHTY